VVLALLLFGIIGMALGAGFDALHGHADFSLDLNGNGIPDHLEIGHAGIIGWANPGHVPSTIFLTLFCGSFALLGYSAQWIYDGLTGSLAPALFGAPIVLALTLPTVRLCSLGLAPVLPKDESNAVSLESLTGSAGVVTVGPIAREDFGMARFTDAHGTDHTVMVCGEGEESIANGSQVVLIGPHRERAYAFIVRKI
jgi:hypothetical protein